MRNDWLCAAGAALALGATIGAGVWLHRRLRQRPPAATPAAVAPPPPPKDLTGPVHTIGIAGAPTLHKEDLIEFNGAPAPAGWRPAALAYVLTVMRHGTQHHGVRARLYVLDDVIVAELPTWSRGRPVPRGDLILHLSRTALSAERLLDQFAGFARRVGRDLDPVAASELPTLYRAIA